MKRTVFWFGMLVMVLTFGIVVAACDIRKDKLDGTTWKARGIGRADSNGIICGTDYVLTFNSPNFTIVSFPFGDWSWLGKMPVSGEVRTAGTYTVSGNTVKYDGSYDGQPAGGTGTLSGKTLTFGSATYTKQ